jgi:DNA processing protein
VTGAQRLDRQELAAWLRLALTPQVGHGTARRLLAAFGLPAHIFQAQPSALRAVATPAQVQALQTEPPALSTQIDSTWEWLAQGQGQRRVLTLADTDYPGAVLRSDDPPLMLYAMGEALRTGQTLEWPSGIAIVGSRNPTAQGAQNAKQFARHFAQSGWCVISGLALGVDAAAHEGALDGAIEGAGPATPARWATIAVVGTGLDRVYPRQHEALARRITDHGLILSEYPLGTPPLSENFPRRNRILSALARGTLVVEAAVRSGSLITARFAAEQGREVFAIPGSIHSPQSRGCHALIKQGVKLVESAQDVLDELPGEPSRATERTADKPPNPDDAALPDDPLLQALGFDPATLDALGARTGLDAPTLLAHLLTLELQGEVARLPGGLFQRMATA